MRVPAWLKQKRIGVLYGGLSEEREISERTGHAVLNAFLSLGLNALGITADRSLPKKLLDQKISYCFIALHGRYGEDGSVQGLCEVMGIPYSGSGVLASALSMDKAASKLLFQSAGIPTPSFVTSSTQSSKHISLPCVVKPIDSGSAIGVTIVRKKSQAAKAVREALKISKQALIERFIDGKELTAAVLGERVLPLVEIVPKRSFYDFSAKYKKGMSDHFTPARISKKAAKKISEIALLAHRTLFCRAYSRVDFILDGQGRPWVLELNSIPGMTETSLFPEAAKAAGMSFQDLLIEMVQGS